MRLRVSVFYSGNFTTPRPVQRENCLPESRKEGAKMSMYWPIALLVFSNVFYHICTKSVPESLNPYAMMTGTYLIGMLLSLALYFFISPEKNLAVEVGRMNWTTLMLGFSIVGLEVGAIYMYKVGWNISVGNLVQSTILTVALIVIGVLIYKETITSSQIFGIVLCAAGLFFINR